MTPNRHAAFIPWATMYIGFASNTDEERHFKMATLAFDDVYLPVAADQLSRIRVEMANDLNLRLAGLVESWHSIESIHPTIIEQKTVTNSIFPDGSMLYDENGAWRDGLRDAIDIELEAHFEGFRGRIAQMRDSRDYDYIKEGNALANSAVGSVQVWSTVRTYADCAYFAFNRVEFAAADLLLCHDERSAFRAANLLIPDAGELSWEQVFEIRERPEALSFRRWLGGRKWGNPGDKSVEEDVIGALLEIAEECRPNLGLEILKGVASNIPLPIPVNPLSVALSAKSVNDARRFNQKYDWAYFISQRRARKTED